MNDDPTTPKGRAIPIAEDLHAPEYFAGECPYFSIGTTTLTVTLVSYRWDMAQAPPVQTQVVTGRLTMPIPAAQELAMSLYDFLAKHGLDPAQREKDRPVQ